MNAIHILNENESDILTVKSRRQLIRHLVEFQTQRFGEKAKQSEMDAIATAAGFIFKMLSAVSAIYKLFFK